jgi:hypothetical protein
MLLQTLQAAHSEGAAIFHIRDQPTPSTKLRSGDDKFVGHRGTARAEVVSQPFFERLSLLLCTSRNRASQSCYTHTG